MPGVTDAGGGGTVNSIRWVPVLVVTVCSVAQAQYAPPPPSPYGPPQGTGYGPGPTYGRPDGYGEPHRQRGQIEISGYAGYQVSTDASTCCGTLVIDGSAVYGAALGYQVRPGYGVELSWFYVPTKVSFQTFNPGIIPSTAEKASLGEHWIQIGGVGGWRRGRLEPYGTLSLGLVIISPSAARLTDGSTLTPESSVRFAFTAGLGLKVWITEMIAFRAEARALVPVYFNSAGFYVGTGGTGVGLSGGIPFAQFAFTGGLTVAL